MKSVNLLIFLLGCGMAFSQNNKQIAFRELTVEQGLSQNSVVSIAQDSTGYMWFATQDGLNKYDGKHFVHFPYQFEDVTRNTYSKLGKIYIANDDQIWIVSNSGVLHKQDKTSQTFNQVANLKNVSTLVQHPNKDYFIGTYGTGLYRISENRKDTIQLLKPEDKSLVAYAMCLFNGRVLVATTNGILVIETNGTYRFVKVAAGTNFSSFSIMPHSNTLFLGSYGKGLFMAQTDSLAFKPFLGFEKEKLPTDLIIQDILVDSQEKLWIATYGDGAYLVDFKNESIAHFVANKTNPYALHYNDVLSLYEDFTGLIWLGTDGAGLSYYDEDLVKFNVLTNKQAPNTINIDFVRAITESQGAVWLGTSNKGLTAIDFKSETYQMYTTKNSTLASDRIMSLYNNESGLWVGHQNNGLQKFEGDQGFRSYGATKGVSIWKIYPAENQRLWLCTLDGLLLFDEREGIVKSFNSKNSALTTNAIRTVEAGAKDQLWIGAESQGLFLLNTRTETIEYIAAIPDRIKSLYFSNDILWIGTNGDGLKSFNPKTGTVKHFTTEQGLANNVVYGILPGLKNELWLSSNKGLTKITVATDEIAAIENFSNYDGLQTNEFNTGAYFKDTEGNLYFGGLEGLNWFNPNQLSYNAHKPKTVITDFKIFSKPHPIAPNSRFSSKQNTMTFTFSGLHYSQPDRNQYRYQLVNHDPDWIDAGNNNNAHYTNLPPDDYTFRVISSNYDGVWNTEPATYSFTILKPWYATNLAKAVYAVVLILFGIYLYRYLKWRWEIKTQLRLEHAETNRLKKLDEMKTRLYTNISHEFRTPLTLISGPIENQLAKAELSKKDKKELSLVKQNTDRLVSLVDQMLDLSMLDSGQRKLAIKRGNLEVLLKQLISAFQYKATEKNMTISSKIHDLKAVWFDTDVLEKVVSNLLSNAIKYAPKDSTIHFEAYKQEGALVLSLVNKSERVDKKDLSKLFQRFYQDNKLADGVGVGLALVKELVTLSKGTVVANNIDNDKIQFTVSLPIERAAFDETEIAADKPIADSQADLQKTNNTADTEKPLLLVVEDETDIREFIVSIFKNNYRTLEATNGNTGIEKAFKTIPDLIISDVMMPETDGITLCDTLKTNELTSHIPIILLTAKVGEHHEIEGLKTGADAYVTKPFKSENLKVRVQKLIENRRQLQRRFSKTLSIAPDVRLTSTENEFLKRLQTVLNAHITEPDFTSERFGELMLMSRTQLHRKLKAIAGMSASEFIRSQRLNLAAKLMHETDASIAEIAYQVGFNTPSYFSKCFKEVYKCTPNEYLSNNL